jgi:prepilin-type N-terminal cleavage/methylation domain-containing protein
MKIVVPNPNSEQGMGSACVPRASLGVAPELSSRTISELAGAKYFVGRSFRRDAENDTPEAYAPGCSRGHEFPLSAFRFPLFPQRAFTLIEVVISSALMSLILVAAYVCLNAGLNTQKLIEPRADVIQNARVAMAILTADLRGACALSKEYQFLGMRRLLGEMDADNLDFATHNYTPTRPGEGDFCQESIYLDRDPETGQFSLWRRRNPIIAPDPLSGGSKEEIAKGVVGVRFEYFDGLDWYESWGEIKSGRRETTQRLQPNLSGMPEAVRITLMFDSNPKSKAVSDSGERVLEPPFVFTTVARLNLAAVSQGSSSSADSGAADSGSAEGVQPIGGTF